MARVAVLGAGVVGLSTAVNIQACLPDAQVTVIADNFLEDTTSYGSGGIFLPTTKSHPNEPVERMRRWCRDSWARYEQLVTGPEAGEAGAVMMTGYFIHREKVQDPLYKEFVFNYRELTPEEMKRLRFRPIFKHGCQVTTLVINQGRYLQWLMDRIKRQGGTFEKRRIHTLEEFVGKYDLCVNCSGLASRELLTDPEVYAGRGQLVKVQAPWIKHWYYTEDRTYIIPNENFVNLGGYLQVGKESLDVDPEDTKDVLERCRREFPLMSAAQLTNTWVGLRPCRTTIRLEAETFDYPSGQIKCVHHYGHGPNGVALSWGSSLEAAGLVKQLACGAKL